MCQSMSILHIYSLVSSGYSFFSFSFSFSFFYFFCFKTGPARVWLANQNIPGLAMSRSLCDEVAKQAGVISEPEIYHVKLGPEVVYMCMATDGLWEFLSNQEVVDMINSVGQDPQKAINILMKKSEELWRTNEEVVDDTSIIIAYMTDL